MKIFDKLRNMVGLGPERSAPPPQPLAIADGLLVTERRAEAWFTLSTSNSDLATDAEQEDDLARIMAAAERTLAGRDLHLKVVWGRITGEDYADSVCPDPQAIGREWAELRGQRIDDLELPERHVLLGVHLTDRNTDATADARRTGSDTVFGPGAKTIRRAELRRLDAQMRTIAQQLMQTPWKARPAAAEQIGWMLGREHHRTITAVPREGMLTGAAVGRLTQGRVVPFSDHLRIYDAEGRVLAYTAVMAVTDFPEYMDFPGDGEWLRTLSEIKRVRSEDEIIALGLDEVTDPDNQHAVDYDGIDMEVPVLAEASMRWRLMSRRQARKTADEARSLAKEQRRSAAKGSAEETTEEVAETEDTMRGLIKEISRDGITLVEDHPRIVVTESSLNELRAACAAVSAHYSNVGITVEVAADEQREMWLESLPGDMLRVPDLGHVHDQVGLFGASWWAGSRVGATEPHVPVIGYLTGTTAGLVRNSLTAGSARGDATTTAYIGRAGRGKTTAMMLALLDAASSGAWVPFLDFKGDCAGAVAVARRFSIPAGVIKADSSFVGAADLFRILPSDEAILQVEAQFDLLIHPSQRARAARFLMPAVTEVSKRENPTSADVVDLLRQHEDPEARELGDQLHALAQTPLGLPVLGRPANGEAPKFTTKPGLWLLQFPGLSLPEPTDPPEKWNTVQRASMACFRGFTAWVVNTMKDERLRTLPKLVGLPEVHLITALQEGRSFLTFIARLGRALGGSLAIDTQDPESIAMITGLVEQITTVFGFQQISLAQQVALAGFLGLDPEDPEVHATIGAINKSDDGKIRHGHCIMRDYRDDAATVQIDIPSKEVEDMLSTSPDNQYAQRALEAAGTTRLEEVAV